MSNETSADLNLQSALVTPHASSYLKDKGFPVTRGTLEVWRALGKGPRYRKLSGRVFYLVKDLDDFLNSAEVFETIHSKS